ncbi:MAG: DUF91 domain-containing protein [Chloroflexi bacterium]|nr:DUF91 domain-containing protein [Chloroflexota bacterium]MCH8065545.1 DUF91 domain-containing protein [Chloroflexota bacterium]
MAASAVVRESQIEDVLASFPPIAQRTLGLSESPQLVARQMIVPSGRLDLLYATGQTLTLVELKVEKATSEFVEQIYRYANDLKGLQAQAKLVAAPIDLVLLCPAFRRDAIRACAAAGVQATTYSPDDVLAEYFRSLRPLAELIELRPIDLGVWNIHLIHRALYELTSAKTAKAIAPKIDLSDKTVANHLSFALQLKLVEREGTRFGLSELGSEYVDARNHDMPVEYLSETQAAVLRGFIVKDPFASPTIFGIFSMVEVIFNLARNGYPVPRELVTSHYREVTGKLFEWSAEKTAYHGTRMYSNYAIELGLLGRSGDALYLTPDGIRFILLLQLHKSLKMIDVVGLERAKP